MRAVRHPVTTLVVAVPAVIGIGAPDPPLSAAA
jgi:hypothetical protein